MNKLLKLEAELRKAKEELVKSTEEKIEKSISERMDEILKKGDLGAMITAGIQGSGSTPQEGVNTAIGSISKDEDEEEEKKDKEKDKKMIEEKMDEHNEKKHGEPKDEDSAITKKEDCEKSELVKFHSNGQWSINKAVRDEDVSSRHTDPTINPKLGGKYGKIHGGDPKKGEKDPITGDMAIDVVDGKPKKRVSGASSLRADYNTRQEDGREQSD
jgi:hypothetical protein